MMSCRVQPQQPELVQHERWIGRRGGQLLEAATLDGPSAGFLRAPVDPRYLDNEARWAAVVVNLRVCRPTLVGPRGPAPRHV